MTRITVKWLWLAKVKATMSYSKKVMPQSFVVPSLLGMHGSWISWTTNKSNVMTMMMKSQWILASNSKKHFFGRAATSRFPLLFGLCFASKKPKKLTSWMIPSLAQKCKGWKESHSSSQGMLSWKQWMMRGKIIREIMESRKSTTKV